MCSFRTYHLLTRMHQLSFIVTCATPELSSQVKVLVKIFLTFQKKKKQEFILKMAISQEQNHLFPEWFSGRVRPPGCPSWEGVRVVMIGGVQGGRHGSGSGVGLGLSHTWLLWVPHQS